MTQNRAHGEARIAVVSGGAGYVGTAIVKSLVETGFVVATVYRETKPVEMENVHPFKCDLNNEEDVSNLFKQIEAKLGKPYAIIHAAGAMPAPVQLVNATTADLQNEFDKNIRGAFIFLTTGARILRDEKRGVIVGITTANVAVSKNTKARGLYSLSKYALQGMLVSLREELAKFGVGVYSIAPGVMPGGMNKGTPKAFLDIVKSQGKTGKLTSAEEVGEVVRDLVTGARKTDEFTIVLAPETE